MTNPRKKAAEKTSEQEVKQIVDKMNRRQPLPMGRAEFEEWSDRIITGAMLAGNPEGAAALRASQKFVLADMLMHLPATESHKEDAFFIHSMRNAAVRRCAHIMRGEYQTIGKQLAYDLEESVEREVLAEAELAAKEGREPAVLTDFQKGVMESIAARKAAEAYKAKAQVSTPTAAELAPGIDGAVA